MDGICMALKGNILFIIFFLSIKLLYKCILHDCSVSFHQYFCNFSGHVCQCVVYSSEYPAQKCKQLWWHGIVSDTYLLISGNRFHILWIIIVEMSEECITFHSGLQFNPKIFLLSKKKMESQSEVMRNNLALTRS